MIGYIVKRSDGAVWARSPDHPAYFWYKDQQPVVYATEAMAAKVVKLVKGFHNNGQLVTVEKYNG